MCISMYYLIYSFYVNFVFCVLVSLCIYFYIYLRIYSIYMFYYIWVHLCMCVSMAYMETSHLMRVLPAVERLLLVHSYSNSTVLPVGHFSVFPLSRREAPDLCLTPKLKLQVRVKHKLAIVRKQNARQERGHIRHARAVVHHNLTTLVPLLLCPI